MRYVPRVEIDAGVDDDWRRREPPREPPECGRRARAERCRVTDGDGNHAASRRGAAENREVRHACSDNDAGRRAAPVRRILISRSAAMLTVCAELRDAGPPGGPRR